MASLQTPNGQDVGQGQVRGGDRVGDVEPDPPGAGVDGRVTGEAVGEPDRSGGRPVGHQVGAVDQVATIGPQPRGGHVVAERDRDAGQVVQAGHVVLGQHRVLVLERRVGAEGLGEGDAALTQVRRLHRVRHQVDEVLIARPDRVALLGHAVRQQVHVRPDRGAVQRPDAGVDGRLHPGHVLVGPEPQHVPAPVRPAEPHLPVDVVLGDVVVQPQLGVVRAQQPVGEQHRLALGPVPEGLPVGHQVLAGEVRDAEAGADGVEVGDRHLLGLERHEHQGGGLRPQGRVGGERGHAHRRRGRGPGSVASGSSSRDRATRNTARAATTTSTSASASAGHRRTTGDIIVE